MQWSDVPRFIWIAIALGAALILQIVLQSQRSKTLGQRLEMVARELGWSDVRLSTFFGLAVKGMWKGYAVSVRRAARQKNAPERVITRMRVQVPARIEIVRRQRGLWSGKPLAMFGPPLVELPSSAQFWIRADEITLAERLMMSSAAPLFDRNLFSRFDFFRLRRDEMVIQRVSERDPDGVARIAREELQLARAVVEALGLGA